MSEIDIVIIFMLNKIYKKFFTHVSSYWTYAELSYD